MNVGEKLIPFYKVTRTFKVCGKVEKHRVVGGYCYKSKGAAIKAAYTYIEEMEKLSETKYRVTLDEKYPLEAINGNEEGCSIHIRVEELSLEERETMAVSKLMDCIKRPDELFTIKNNHS